MQESKVNTIWKEKKKDKDYGAIQSTANWGHSHFYFTTNQVGEHYVLQDNKMVAGPFESTMCVANGFIQVFDEKGKEYIDILGRISPEITKSGVQMFSYLNGYISLIDLEAEHFTDDIFYKAVIKEEHDRLVTELKERYADTEKLSEFDVDKIHNTARMIEAKREGCEQRVKMLKAAEIELKRAHEAELKENQVIREHQNDRIETYFEELQRC